ncbi:MAG: hypothetical protein ACOVO9_08185 [Bacteroidia bacterium]
MKNEIRASQEKIYKELYEKHKGTPMAVSSESLAHKKVRFTKISEIFKDEEIINVHDVGMGLAGFYEFLLSEFPNKLINYSGSEILEEYVKDCSLKFPNNTFYNRDLSDGPGDEKYDYLIMSGVFHQRQDSTILEWEKFSQRLIKNAFSMCKKGIALNFVSPFVDFYQPQIYYNNLPKLLNFINDDVSRFFEIKHNYALFEFTVFIYNQDFIKSSFPQNELQKYFK